MSPGTSVRAARTRWRKNSSRSTKRRTSGTKQARRSRRRRRALVIGGTLLLGAMGGLFLANSDWFERTLQEVTLPLRHEDIIRQQAEDKDVPADLIAAVIYTESRFRDQTSPAGARGLMQITPSTAHIIADLSRGSTFTTDDLSDPDINIRYGTFYLHYLIEKFDGNIVAALAAYNAGETNVAAWGGSDLSIDDIEFPQTREYVENVLEKRNDYAQRYPHELGID